jgi:hypothetical protein
LDEATSTGNAPLLNLFHGETVDESRRSGWRKKTAEIAIPGYPIAKVRVIEIGIPRTIPVGDLKQILEIHQGREQKGSREAAVALTFLCEAVELISSIPERRPIPINAPISPDQWFKPFNLEPSRASADQIAEMLPLNARRAAQEFLYAVVDGKDTHALRQGYLKQIRVGS